MPTPSRPTCWREKRRRGEGGGCGAESYDRRKAWPSINHSILSAGYNIPKLDQEQICKKSYVRYGGTVPTQEKKSRNLFAGCEEDEFIVLGHPLQELHKVGPSPHKHLTQMLYSC
jgi:hypothetical protein